ncbi:hypothetical protein [Actinoplanes sp. NPDC051494]|uniref:hypothetical protein n=1 Tax=Actinoplanes sp. NPDC051494 TaxID=3363907 RepID=UPI003794A64E
MTEVEDRYHRTTRHNIAASITLCADGPALIGAEQTSKKNQGALTVPMGPTGNGTATAGASTNLGGGGPIGGAR